MGFGSRTDADSHHLVNEGLSVAHVQPPHVRPPPVSLTFLTCHRMSLSQNLAVKFVAAYTAAGFVIMEILYLGVWCRPFNQYWAVPPENSMSSLSFN